MKTLIAPVLFALFVTAPIAAAEPAAGSAPQSAIDAAKLAGTYQIISSEKNGEPSAKEKIDGVVVVFTKDKIVATNRDKDDVYAATYKLDATQMPTHITMVSVMENSKGVNAKGLIQTYQHEGKDRVKLIYTLPDGKIMPTEFKTVDGQVMVVLEKVGAIRTAEEDMLIERR